MTFEPLDIVEHGRAAATEPAHFERDDCRMSFGPPSRQHQQPQRSPLILSGMTWRLLWVMVTISAATEPAHFTRANAPPPPYPAPPPPTPPTPLSSYLDQP